MSEKLLRAIGNVSDTLIKQADIKTTKPRAPIFWLKTATAAAVIGLCIFSATATLHPNSPSQLPTVSVQQQSGSYGFEGYMVYDIGELVNSNPWTPNAQLYTLPVFKNPLRYDESGRVAEPDTDALYQLLRNTAALLGLEGENLEIYDNLHALSEKQLEQLLQKLDGVLPPVDYYYFEAPGMKVEVDLDSTVTIYFDPAVSLPERYDFTHYASYDSAIQTAAYLLSQYRGLLDMEDPLVNISGGDYNIYAQQRYHISFFEGSQSLTQRILNYHFNQVHFACDDEGKLFLIRLDQQDLSQKIGDYPLITASAAEELLRSGTYISSCTEPVGEDAQVAGVELQYLSGKNPYFIPYYRFYVELPQLRREDGLKTYGAYYVPAIEQRYISDMPQWDGSFIS